MDTVNPVVTLLQDMWPAGIPPADYARVVILALRQLPHTATPVRSAPPAAAAPKAPPKRRGRPPKVHAGAAPTGTVKERVRAYLEQRGSAGRKEIIQAIGAPAPSVYDALSKLGVKDAGGGAVTLPEPAGGAANGTPALNYGPEVGG